MADFAVSTDPGVQRQLDRLGALSPGGDILGLDRIMRLLDRLGNPQRDLPPVFHVAGTNGKGSTCAFLRAAIEASGQDVHVYTSPHLVRFNERIRIAGRLVDDAMLSALLAEVLDAADGIGPSFFEATTAAAFLAFTRTPAAACVIEVGLGGRLDATNIVEHPAVCGIAQLGLDHQAFLGNRLEDIAAEKAGIAKAGVPLVTLHYPRALAERINHTARDASAHWLPEGADWNMDAHAGGLHYRDAAGTLDLPAPRLPGAHQSHNAGLAVAMLRHQAALDVPEASLRAAMGGATWPARLQRLTAGPLPALLPAGAELWLDGGHNPAAARVIANHFHGTLAVGQPFDIVLGLLEAKDALGFLKPFAQSAATIYPVPVPGHVHHLPETLSAAAHSVGLRALTAADPIDALLRIARHAAGEAPPVVLIGGSLYLAGTALAANGTPPS